MKRRSFQGVLIFFMMALLAACATGGAQKMAEDTASSGAGPLITGITILDEADMQVIDIEADSPLTFTLYKPSDPFRAVLEITSARLGDQDQRILVDRDSIFEIVPEQIMDPVAMARLEIGLTAPVDISPRAEGSHLYLEVPKASLSEGEAFAASTPPVMAEPEPVAAIEPALTPSDQVPEAEPWNQYPGKHSDFCQSDPGRKKLFSPGNR